MLQIAWCSDRNDAERLARFFAHNITQSYISHSELQFGRATAPDQWIADLPAKFKAEIEERLPHQPGSPLRLVSAHADGELVGLAYVTFERSVPIPFMILEDIVVAQPRRGSLIGQAMVDWIFAQARQEGISRAFLESGKENHDAHHFFQRNGFRQVSIVMMADLT